MQFPRCLRVLIVTVMFVCIQSPLSAQEVDQLGWIELREEWGQVLFCQRIYKLPGVTSRLYSFDVEHCDKAGQLMLNVVSKYSQQEQVELKNQAESHAFALSRNTSEPYHAVPACRSYCSELSDNLDEK